MFLFSSTRNFFHLILCICAFLSCRWTCRNICHFGYLVDLHLVADWPFSFCLKHFGRKKFPIQSTKSKTAWRSHKLLDILYAKEMNHFEPKTFTYVDNRSAVNTTFLLRRLGIFSTLESFRGMHFQNLKKKRFFEISAKIFIHLLMFFFTLIILHHFV